MRRLRARQEGFSTGRISADARPTCAATAPDPLQSTLFQVGLEVRRQNNAR